MVITEILIVMNTDLSGNIILETGSFPVCYRFGFATKLNCVSKKDVFISQRKNCQRRKECTDKPGAVVVGCYIRDNRDKLSYSQDT